MKKSFFIKNWILMGFFALGLSAHICRSNQIKPVNPLDLAQEFVKLLQANDFSRAFNLFDDTLKEIIPAEKLQEVWLNLIKQVGPFQGQTDLQTDQRKPYYIVINSCKFEKMSVDVKIVFDRNNRITGFWFLAGKSELVGPFPYFAPFYVEKEAFSEQEVVVGVEPWQLSGTLTIPKGNGPFAAIVLIHDIGPHDRDETIGPNKPFRDLAWGLASRSIAILRYEKRTKVYENEINTLMKKLTVKTETIDDVLAAYSWLRQNDQIDPDRIFLLGHGLGGMLIPRIEKDKPDFAGSIIMAGMSRSLEDVHFREINYIFSLDGKISADEKEQLDQLRKQIALVKDPKLSEMATVSELPLGLPKEYWLDIRQYNPVVVAGELTQPMLILQGGRDYQVTLDDFQGWKKESLLERENVQFKLYLRLNHLFMSGQGSGKSTPTEYQIPDHVAQIVIEDIANWIIDH